MAYGLSNGHVTDDVMWPWKVKLVTPIRLERNISKTAGDTDSVPTETAHELSNGHVTDDVTWHPDVLWGSTVGYLSDSLASCCNCCCQCLVTLPNAPNYVERLHCRPTLAGFAETQFITNRILSLFSFVHDEVCNISTVISHRLLKLFTRVARHGVGRFSLCALYYTCVCLSSSKQQRGLALCTVHVLHAVC